MLWGDKKKVEVSLQLDKPYGRDFYTNEDYLTGTVQVSSTNKIVFKDLKLTFYGISSSSVPEVKVNSTYYQTEKHTCIKLEEILVDENSRGLLASSKNEAVLPPGNHVYRFKLRIPGSDVILPCEGSCKVRRSNDITEYNLPPSFEYKGVESRVETKYGVRAFLERGGKGNLIDSQSVKFIPDSLFATYRLTHDKSLRLSGREQCLNYSFKLRDSLQSQQPQTPFGGMKSRKHSNKRSSKQSKQSSAVASSAATINNSSNSDVQSVYSLGGRSSFLKNSGFFSRASTFKSSPLSSSYTTPTNTSLYRSDSHSSYSSSGRSSMISREHSVESKTPTSINFAKPVRDFFSTKGASTDYELPISIFVSFHQNIYHNFDKIGVLKHQGSLAQHMKIYMTTTVSPFDLFKDIIDLTCEDNEDLNMADLDKFQLTSLDVNLTYVTITKTPSTHKSEVENKSLLSLKNIIHDIDLLAFEKIDSECRVIYRYELDPHLLNCVIDSDIPSFEFCNASRDYQLTVSGDLKSLGSNSTKKFQINTDVIILA